MNKTVLCFCIIMLFTSLTAHTQYWIKTPGGVFSYFNGGDGDSTGFYDYYSYQDYLGNWVSGGSATATARLNTWGLNLDVGVGMGPPGIGVGAELVIGGDFNCDPILYPCIYYAIAGGRGARESYLTTWLLYAKGGYGITIGDGFKNPIMLALGYRWSFLEMELGVHFLETETRIWGYSQYYDDYYNQWISSNYEYSNYNDKTYLYFGFGVSFGTYLSGPSMEKTRGGFGPRDW